MAGGGSMQFKGGTYTAVVNLDVNEALKDVVKLDDALRKIGATLSALSQGKDLSAYWDEQAASIENVIAALDTFKQDMKSVDGAENLVKALNAFAAWHPDDNITQYFDRLGAGAQELIDKAKSMSTSLDSAFSVPSLRDAIQAFEMLRDAGVDVATMVSKLKQGDLSALTNQLQTLEKESGRNASTIRYLREQINSFESGEKFQEMSDNLKRFRDSAEVAKEEFRSFLEVAGFSGEDLGSWGQFRDLFNDIETGSKTATQAMDAVRSAYADMFNAGATTGQLSSINSSLAEMKELLTDVRGASGGSGGIFNGGGGGPGGPGGFDDKLQQIIDHLAQLNDALSQVSAAIGSIGQGGEDSITPVVDALQRLVTVVDELNSKDFSIQNVFQSGNAELDAANNLRAYREEAIALNTYLTTLRNSITDTGNSSRAFGRTMLQMREQFDILGDFDPEKIKKQIANAKDLGQLDSIIVQLNEYRNAMQQIVDVGKQVGVEVAMPDTARLDEARQKVAELTSTVQEESGAVSEAATSAEQLSNALSVTEKGLSSASAQELSAAFETLKTTLETIRGQIDSAFDLTQQIANVQQLSAAYQQLSEQIGLVNQNIALQASGGDMSGVTVTHVADLQQQISDLLGQLDDALGRISKAFDLTAALSDVQSFKQEISDVMSMVGTLRTEATNATEQFGAVKFDESIGAQLQSLSGRFAEIGVSLDGLKSKIADTFDLSKAVGDAERLTQAYTKVSGALELVRDLAVAYQKTQQTERSASAANKPADAKREEADGLKALTQLYVQYYDALTKVERAKSSKDYQSMYDFSEVASDLESVIEKTERENDALVEQAREAKEVQRAMQSWREASNRNEARAEEEAIQKARELVAEYERMKSVLAGLDLGTSGIKFEENPEAVEKYTDAINSAKTALDAVRNATETNRDAAVAAFNQEIAAVRRLRDELNSTYGGNASDKQLEAFKRQWINFTQSNSTWYSKNKTAYDEIWAKISSGAQMSSAQLKSLQTEFMSMNNAMSVARQGGKSFFDELKAGWRKFGGWSVVTRTFTAMIRVIKQAVSAVKEIDAAMVELRKVTRLTERQYAEFFDSASASAKKIGSSLSDMINATADFSRLGYSIEDATKLAEAASIYMNVGDKIESMDDATKSIISTMKAFGIEAEDALSIVDKYNEVGNKYPISAAGIGEALQRSAAALSVANNSLEESIGLVVAANDVIQNPEQVGTALKTLTMYLRAAKTEAEEAGLETEGMATSVSKLRNQLLALTNNRLDIMLDENTFKSTFQIMQELSAIWDDLKDVDQSNILGLVGSKRNANIVTSILKNFQDAAAASETAANAAGSAWAENEKYLAGIEGKTKQLQASFQDFSNSVIGSGVVKSLTETATGILNVSTALNKLHLLLPTVIALSTAIRTLRANATANAAAGQISLLFAQGGDMQAIQQQANALVAGLTTMERSLVASKLQMATGSAEAHAYAASLNTAALSANKMGVGVEALEAKTKGLGAAFKSLKTSVSFWIMIATVVVSGIRQIIDGVEQANEQAKQAARDSYNTYTSNAQKYQDDLKSLDKISDRFNELAKGVDESKENLGLANDEYSEFMGYVDQIVAISPDVVAAYTDQGYTLKTKYVDVLNEAIGGIKKLNEESEKNAANTWRNSTGAEDVKEMKKAFEEYRKEAELSAGGMHLLWKNFFPDVDKETEKAKQWAEAWNDALTSLDIDPVLVDVELVPQSGWSLYAGKEIAQNIFNWDEVKDGQENFDKIIEWYAEVYTHSDEIIKQLSVMRDEAGELIFSKGDLDKIQQMIVGRFGNAAGAVQGYLNQIQSDVQNLQLILKYEPSTKDIFSEVFDSKYYADFALGMSDVFDVLDEQETKVTKAKEYLASFYEGLVDVNNALAAGSESGSMEDTVSALEGLKEKYAGNAPVIAMITNAIANLSKETDDATNSTVALSRAYDNLSTAMSNASSASNLLKKIRDRTIDIEDLVPELEKIAEAWNKLFKDGDKQKEWTDFLAFGADNQVDWVGTAANIETYIDAMVDAAFTGTEFAAQHGDQVKTITENLKTFKETTKSTFDFGDAMSGLKDVMSVLEEGFDLSDPVGAIKEAQDLADAWNAARKSIGKSEDKHWTDFIDPADLLSQFGDAAQIIRDGALQIQEAEDEVTGTTTGGINIDIPVEAKLVPSDGMSDAGVVGSDGKVDLAKLVQAYIPDGYSGNVDLSNRKIIPINILTKVGWLNEDGTPLGGDYATLFTNTFSAGDTSKGYDIEYDQNIVCNITPILSDGTVLSPGGIEDYFYDIIQEARRSGKSVMEVDAEQLGLVLNIDVVEEGKSLDEVYEEAGAFAANLSKIQAEWDKIRFENNWFGDDTIDPAGVFEDIASRVRDGAAAIDEASNSIGNAGDTMRKIISTIATAGMSDISLANAGLEEVLDSWDRFVNSEHSEAFASELMTNLNGIMAATRSAHTTTDNLREMYSDLVDSFFETDEKLSKMSADGKSAWKNVIMAAVDEMLATSDLKKKSQDIADSFEKIGDAYTFMQDHAAGSRVENIADVYDELQQLRDLTGNQKIQLSDFIEWDTDLQDYVYKATSLQDTINSLADSMAEKLVDAEIEAGRAMDEALRSDEIAKRAAEIKASLGEVADTWGQMSTAVSNVKSVKSFRESIAGGEDDMLDMLSDAISYAEEFGLKLEDIVSFDAFGQLVFSADALNNALDVSIDKLVDSGVVTRELAEQLKRAAREQQKLNSTQQRLSSSYDKWSELNSTREYVEAQQLTYSQYQQLIEADGRYANALQYSNGQLSINAQKYNEITAAIGAETIAVAKLRIEENKSSINTLIEQYNALEDKQGDRARSIMQDIKRLALETQGYAVLATEIENATSAMNRFLNASSNVNDESYDAATNAFNVIKDTLRNTESEIYMMTGREQFKEAMKFVVGENVEFDDSGFEKAFKAAERYLNGERSGLQNFVDDLFKFNIVDANGDLNMSLDSIASKLGISKDAVASLLKQLNQLDKFNIDLSDETGDAKEDVKSWFDQLTDLTKILDGFEEKGVDFAVSDTAQTSLTQLQEKLEAIDSYIQKINAGINGGSINAPDTGGGQNEDVTTDVTTNVTTNGAEESQAALEGVQGAAESIPSETNTEVKEKGSDGVIAALKNIISLEQQASGTVSPSSSKNGLATLQGGLADVVKKIQEINSMTVQPQSGSISMPQQLWTGTMKAAGGNTLVGELGQEMVVDIRNGRYYTVGTKGPEIVNIPKDAIVYNHLMTAQLLGRNTASRTGAKNVRGASRAAGQAFATGTINPVVPGAKPKPSSPGAKDEAKELEEVLNDIKKKYDEINEDLEHLIKHLEQQFYVNDRALNFDGMASNLAAEANRYQEIIDNCQAGIRDLLAHGADDSSKQVQELEEAMWSAYQSMYDALDQIRALYVDALNEEIDRIQGAYKNLYSALSEYNDNGKITLDTFQSLLENGVQYLSLLQNENGQYEINEQAIQKLIKARKNQLAIETALAYISRIKEALQNHETNRVNALINATQSIASGTWSYVYAQAALLKTQGLTNKQYDQLVQNLHNLQNLTNVVGEDFEGIGEGAKIESIKNKYEELNKEIEHYLEHQEQARKDSERADDYAGQEQALRNKISYWQQIIENSQHALEAMRAEGATDLDENVQAMEQAIWDAAGNVNEAMDSIRELLTNALTKRLKDIQSAFGTMSDAVSEFNENGHISLDTFQSLIEGGVEYLSLLKKENGQYVINENAIRDMIAARKEQLAIETSLSYISRIREALEKGESERINQLADASDLISTNAWSVVYAQLAQLKALGLTTGQYEQILENVQALQQIAADVSFGSVDPTEEDALNDILDKYSKLNDEVEHYIAHQQFAYSQAERALNYDGMVNSLVQQTAYYKQIMQNAQNGIEEMIAEGADDTDEALQNLEEAYWSAYDSMYEALDNIRQLKVDALTAQLDDLQDAFHNLESAADDYNEYGGITLDTFQSMIHSGMQYLSLLDEQGDKYVLSAERVREYTAAQKEHLAIETALSYISNVREALQNKETERIKNLIDATNSVSDATWDYVYAQAALLKTQGLSDEMYETLVRNLDKLRSITASTINDISTAEGNISKEYDNQRDALDKILDYTEDLIKAEADDRIDAINDEIDAYREIIDLKKQALEISKDENEYEEEVAEKVREISKLQAKYEMMALDDSRSAAAERLKLQEEIAEKQKDLASYQRDYSYNAQVKALDDEAEAYEKSRKQDIEDIEASVSSEEKIYQLAIERIRDHWDTLYRDLIAWNTEQGNVINQEITDNWEKAAEAVQKYGSYVAAISGIDEITGGSGNIVVADKLPRYHSGGVVGDKGAINDKEVMAVLQKGELVIDKEAKGGLYAAVSAVEFLESLGRKIGSAVKHIGNLNPRGAFTPAFAGMGTPQSQGYVVRQDVKFDANFNVAVSGVSEGSDAKRVGEQIANSAISNLYEVFNRKGISFTPKLRQG